MLVKLVRCLQPENSSAPVNKLTFTNLRRVEAMSHVNHHFARSCHNVHQIFGLTSMFNCLSSIQSLVLATPQGRKVNIIKSKSWWHIFRTSLGIIHPLQHVPAPCAQLQYTGHQQLVAVPFNQPPATAITKSSLIELVWGKICIDCPYFSDWQNHGFTMTKLRNTYINT